ncbi:hypothetical protein [Labedaea rhizosphaerae]|uniref:Uncharacterized protein n=1 Tax=Labedaea rhizosphaerae TaxID=598644 RepID=A0A4R6S019_LABRH|nr:hypothetical protein [Labedaea rhizosphaerae]TDP92822.1 hypothetical protein EV186_10737 [Labedaea rhizosphaerae]
MGTIDASGGNSGYLHTGPSGVLSPVIWRGLSALALLLMAAIHLYLVFDGVGGVLGVLFVLNAIGGVVLAIAMVAAPRRLLLAASVLGLLFMAGTLLALILALTVGLFGITETLSFTLVPTTLVEESIGVVVLAVTTVVALRAQRSAHA